METKKNSRRVNWNLDRTPQQAKRRCSDQIRAIGHKSEDILWPEKDDSFFTNSKLDNLLNGHDLTRSQQMETTTLEEDSFFGKLDMETTCGSVIKPSQSSSASSLNGDDTLFAGVRLDLFGCSVDTENVDLFADLEAGKDAKVQNTQRFMADMGTIAIPTHGVEDKSEQTLNETVLPAHMHMHQEGVVQGSQYVTCEQLLTNSTLLNQTKLPAEPPPQEQMSLSRVIWDSQLFPSTIVELKKEIPSFGDFYGLPEKVKRLVYEHKGIKSLYEWQDECLNLPAIGQRKNLIYALPTSGGKTLVAEILMLRELICRQKNVLFILPYVSIVQEKVSAMSPFAIALDFIVDEYTAGKGKCPPTPRAKRNSIFIASIEKGAVLMDSLIDARRASEIGLVVVDELHLIGERGRGATLEALLTKVMFLQSSIQIVGMSATIGNLPEMSAFLNADVYTRGFRPVELKEYIKCGSDILEINAAGKSLEETFVYQRTVNFKYSAAVARSDPDHLGGLVAECAPESGCLIFCSTRKNCENVAILLSRILPKVKFLHHRKSEKIDLMDALDKICGILSPALAKTIPFGIAYHHSGLTTDERKFIEAAYRMGVLSVICCTSTLAAGVNLPAKRVIIRAPYVGHEFITLCKYKQMVGRAGRAGLGETGESILIASSRDNVRVGEMLFSSMDQAISSLDFNEFMGLQGLMLSSIGLEMSVCRLDLQRLIGSTLMSVQAGQLGINMSQVLLQIIRDMFVNKVLQVCAGQKADANATTQVEKDDSLGEPTTMTQRRSISISRSTRFELTTIGRAAFKAGIDYKRAQSIHKELLVAQRHLILSNYGHLLYLVVCFNSNAAGDELFSADASTLFDAYSTTDTTTQQLFALLGFTEAHAAKIAKTRSILGPMQLKMNRLFKVLILLDILNVLPLPTVAAKYNVERGTLQNLISQCTSAACALVRLCEEIDELWCFKSLFERISSKMDRCGTAEIEPLLELPGVKINRAKQLYAAGYKTIADIAKCRPIDLVKTVEHMPMRIAKEIISAAMIILMKKLDSLEEETAVLKGCLQPKNDATQ